MKPETKKLLQQYGAVVHFALVICLILVVAIQVHWSVALLFAWMGYTIATFATGINKIQQDYNRKIQAVQQKQKEGVASFNDFIGTVNKQAEEFKKNGNKCIECEKYPGQIRNGSVHNSGDSSCQMYRPPMFHGGGIAVPTELLKQSNRPMCKICEDEGLPDLYYHNNCPIHN